ncbi:hypothetical protein JJE66_36600 [Bradyrhizobium diazoefficiens]|nr:hypothetical protein [Bradyrhizobium diazoefficiens]
MLAALRGIKGSVMMLPDDSMRLSHVSTRI